MRDGYIIPVNLLTAVSAVSCLVLELCSTVFVYNYVDSFYCFVLVVVGLKSFHDFVMGLCSICLCSRFTDQSLRVLFQKGSLETIFNFLKEIDIFDKI